MNLLFFAPAFPPPMEGGSAVYLHNIVSNLPPSDVVVYTQAHPESREFDASRPFEIVRDPHRYTVAEWTVATQVLAVFKWMRRISPILARRKIDVVHADVYLNCGLVAWLLRRTHGVPYVLYAYGEELNQQLCGPSGPAHAIKGALYRRVIRGASGLIAVSRYTAGLLERMGARPSRIHVLRPMIAPSKLPVASDIEAIRAKFGIPGNRKIILSAGRLIARKGHDRLIRSMPVILESCPEAMLLIASRGPELDHLKKIAVESGVNPQVVFAGFVSDTDLSMLYELCEVFAMPHRETADGDTEGCPTVFLEANAHGKPVVGGRAGGVEDAIIDGETGFIVDGENPAEIAKAILKLLRDPALARDMGERGRRRVAEELSPKSGAERVAALSREILQERNRV